MAGYVLSTVGIEPWIPAFAGMTVAGLEGLTAER